MVRISGDRESQLAESRSENAKTGHKDPRYGFCTPHSSNIIPVFVKTSVSLSIGKSMLTSVATVDKSILNSSGGWLGSVLSGQASRWRKVSTGIRFRVSVFDTDAVRIECAQLQTSGELCCYIGGYLNGSRRRDVFHFRPQRSAACKQNQSTNKWTVTFYSGSNQVIKTNARSTTEPSVQLDLDGPRLVMRPLQTVAEDVFTWAVRPKRRVNPSHPY